MELSHRTVIRGMVHNADGKPEPNATVAAVLSDVPGAPTLPIFWTTDSEGSFAQDHFAPGTYYCGRAGGLLAYPPEKIELVEKGDVAVELRLDHKGARVTGQVIPRPGYHLASDARALFWVARACWAPPDRRWVRSTKTGTFLWLACCRGATSSACERARGPHRREGPRDVEVPIDPDTTVALPEPVVVRAQIAE